MEGCSPRVIYKGSKKFEKYGRNVEIMIVSHKTFSCLELIVLGARSHNEATRKYFDLKNLSGEVNLSMLNKNLQSKRNVANDDEEDEEIPTLYLDETVDNFANDLVVNILVARMELVPSETSTDFRISFQQTSAPLPRSSSINHSRICDDLFTNFEIEKPRYLKPYKVIDELRMKLRSRIIPQHAAVISPASSGLPTDLSFGTSPTVTLAGKDNQQNVATTINSDDDIDMYEKDASETLHEYKQLKYQPQQHHYQQHHNHNTSISGGEISNLTDDLGGRNTLDDVQVFEYDERDNDDLDFPSSTNIQRPGVDRNKHNPQQNKNQHQQDNNLPSKNISQKKWTFYSRFTKPFVAIFNTMCRNGQVRNKVYAT